MSFWTDLRDTVTGTVSSIARPILSTVTNPLGAIGGLAGLLGGARPLPPMGGHGQQQMEDFGGQQNLEGLMKMIGDQNQQIGPQVAQTSQTDGGGLI